MEAPQSISTTPVVTPAPIIETTFAFAQSCALLAAVELDIFTWISQGAETLPILAERTNTQASALKRLLGSLSAMGFLQRREHQYMLTPLSERFLVRTSEMYMGDVALQIRNEWAGWIQITDVIRTGTPAHLINKEAEGGHFFAEMVDHLFEIVYPVMHRLCRRLEIGTHLHGLQVLDLGCGTAPSSIAALEQDSDAHAVAIDFAKVLEKTRSMAVQHGVESRMEFRHADLATIELAPATFDLIFASHTLRILGPLVTQHLIQQSYNALKPGGRLVIVETYNNPNQQEKVFPHIVSLNMLINTQAGDAFSLEEMHTWVGDAGFSQVETWSNIAPDPVLVATRS